MACNFDYYFIYGYLSNDLKWIRIRWLNYGIAIKKTPLLFSERNLYTWYLPLPFGWRLTILKAK